MPIAERWNPPLKIDPDYKDFIEYIKLRHSRRLQNLQIKLAILLGLVATLVVLAQGDPLMIGLVVFGFVIICILSYSRERYALDRLEKYVYANAHHEPVSSGLTEWIIYLGIAFYTLLSHTSLCSFIMPWANPIPTC